MPALDFGTGFVPVLDRLQAVNICLGAMGEPSISALESAGVDASIASDLVDERSMTVQLKGWHWNTEDRRIAPNASKEILLPPNLLKIVEDKYANHDVIVRGTRLFDKKTNTFKFDKAFNVTVVIMLPFEELPVTARSFIAYSSAAIFQQRQLGSPSIDQNLMTWASESYAELVKDEIKITNPNMLKDSWSTASILHRRGFRRGGSM